MFLALETGTVLQFRLHVSHLWRCGESSADEGGDHGLYVFGRLTCAFGCPPLARLYAVVFAAHVALRLFRAN